MYFGDIIGEGRATQVPTDLLHDDTRLPVTATRGERATRYQGRRKP